MIFMIYIELLITACLICFIIDISGFIDELEHMLQRITGVPLLRIPKPFSCSLCSTWWAGLIYLLVVGAFTIINIGFVALLAMLTPVITDLLTYIRDVISNVINTIAKYTLK